jgi:hypothetical protein
LEHRGGQLLVQSWSRISTTEHSIGRAIEPFGEELRDGGEIVAIGSAEALQLVEAFVEEFAAGAGWPKVVRGVGIEAKRENLLSEYWNSVGRFNDPMSAIPNGAFGPHQVAKIRARAMAEKKEEGNKGGVRNM